MLRPTRRRSRLAGALARPPRLQRVQPSHDPALFMIGAHGIVPEKFVAGHFKRARERYEQATYRRLE